MQEKGLIFFDYDDIELILRKLGWDENRLNKERCIVCGCKLTKENVGAFTRHSPVKGVCRKFECLVSVLLREKKEVLLA